MNFSIALVLLLLCCRTNADQCSDIMDLNRCESSSPYCYIVYAGQQYQSIEYPDGIILSVIDDNCRSSNFFTACKNLGSALACGMSSCFWDYTTEICYEWDVAPCQAYPSELCQWNIDCELYIQELTLRLDVNYTVLNSVDTIQSDGRRNGTWLYEFGTIIEVKSSTAEQESYKFAKCSSRNICSLIQGISNCYKSDLDCYFNTDEQACILISHEAPCEKISVQSRCESGSAPCIWLSGKCYQYGNPEIPCSQLGIHCMMNEKCYFDGTLCRPYLSCSDFKKKQDCEITQLFNCYYDSNFNECNKITTQTACTDIAQRNCEITKICIWKAAPVNQCQFISDSIYCSIYSRSQCALDEHCEWNANIQQCNWKQLRFTRCQALSKQNCDLNINRDCYFEQISNLCTPIQYYTLCIHQGQQSCGMSEYSKCTWVNNQCISIYTGKCENLPTNVCAFGQNCYIDVTCKTLRQCSDNGNQIEDCWNDSLNCYFDYSSNKCRRVTASTNCSQIFRHSACNVALCAWKNEKCLQLEDVSCSLLADNRCNYSTNCYFLSGNCNPVMACSINDDNKEQCDLDTRHCYFDVSTQKCMQIDGNTDCADIVGASNCNFGSCVMQPQSNQILKCFEYSEADCSYLKKDYCHFGQCRWNSVELLCKKYPEVTQGNKDENKDENKDDNTNENTDQNNSGNTDGNNQTITNNTAQTSQSQQLLGLFLIMIVQF